MIRFQFTIRVLWANFQLQQLWCFLVNFFLFWQTCGCRSNATVQCRDAIHQLAKEYPDECKGSTNQNSSTSWVPMGYLTSGAWFLKIAESCPTSGSGEAISWASSFILLVSDIFHKAIRALCAQAENLGLE